MGYRRPGSDIHFSHWSSQGRWSSLFCLRYATALRSMPFDVSGEKPSGVNTPRQQYACRCPLVSSSFGRSPSSGQREHLSGCSGGSWIGVKIAFGILFVIILRYKYIAHFRYLAPLRYDSGKTRISKKSVLKDLKARGFRNLFSPSTKTGTRGFEWG